ncbi:hypothetical protein ACTHGU_00555 [Chitinophagaceae bacterium MMS25-I14]
MRQVKITGIWASLLAILFSTGYSVAQLLSTSGLLSPPHDLFWLFLPSLFLAPSFLVTIICLHFIVRDDQKLWTFTGVAFAILYTALVSPVYFTELTVVVPDQLKGIINEKQVLLFDRRTFLMAVDCLGYFYMSLSTFFASIAFRHDIKNKWLYRSMLYNGLLIPILILAYFFPFFYCIGAVWMITFPLAMINAAKLFYTAGIPGVVRRHK